MKTAINLLILLFAVICYAQNTSGELAQKAFDAALKNDAASLKVLCPTSKILKDYHTKAAPEYNYTLTDAQKDEEARQKTALNALEVFTEAVTFYGIDPEKIVVGENEAVENEYPLTDGSGQKGTARTTIITLYFSHADKQYAFLVPDAIQVNNKWYLGDKGISLHKLEEIGD